MRMDLRRFFECDGIKESFDYSFSVDDALVASPIRTRGVIANSAGVVSVRAVADFTVSARCACCDAPIERRMSVPVEHLLVTRLNNEDNDDYIIVGESDFDFDKLVSEDVFLAMPFRFLCREDCKGLCPVCGADLNTEKCNCKKNIDPRWAALQQILDGND